MLNTRLVKWIPPTPRSAVPDISDIGSGESTGG